MHNEPTYPAHMQRVNLTPDETAELRRLHELLRGYGETHGALLANMLAALLADDRAITEDDHMREISSCRHAVQVVKAGGGQA